MPKSFLVKWSSRKPYYFDPESSEDDSGIDLVTPDKPVEEQHSSFGFTSAIASHVQDRKLVISLADVSVPSVIQQTEYRYHGSTSPSARKTAMDKPVIWNPAISTTLKMCTHEAPSILRPKNSLALIPPGNSPILMPRRPLYPNFTPSTVYQASYDPFISPYRHSLYQFPPLITHGSPPLITQGPHAMMSQGSPNRCAIPNSMATSSLLRPMPADWSPLKRPMSDRESSSDVENREEGGCGPAFQTTFKFECSACQKTYSTESGLTKHRQFHCVRYCSKTFSCKHCDKVYMSLGALKMHIRTHTLPCKCHMCGKCFSRPWLLQGHIRTHTGEKPFSCHLCSRAFADRSNLRAHAQTHSDVKKYRCSRCGKTFSRMSLLTKHLENGCSGKPVATQRHTK